MEDTACQEGKERRTQHTAIDVLGGVGEDGAGGARRGGRHGRRGAQGTVRATRRRWQPGGGDLSGDGADGARTDGAAHAPRDPRPAERRQRHQPAGARGPVRCSAIPEQDMRQTRARAASKAQARHAQDTGETRALHERHKERANMATHPTAGTPRQPTGATRARARALPTAAEEGCD